MSPAPRAYRRGADGKAIVEVVQDPEAPPETWPIIAVRNPRNKGGRT